MVAATHGCPQATPEGSLHHVKRHDVPSVHPLAGGELVMSLRPLRIRREHLRREHRRPLRAAPVERLTHSLGGGAESKLFTTGPLLIEVAAERMHLGQVGAWVVESRPDGNPSMACVQT